MAFSITHASFVRRALGILLAFVALAGNPRAQSPAAAFYTIGDLPGVGDGFTTIIRDATKAGGVIYAVGGAVARRACVPSGLCAPDTPVLWHSDAPNALQALPDYSANTSTTQIQAFAITPDAAYIASQAREMAATLVTRATRVSRSQLPLTTANLNLGVAPYSPPGPASAAFAISTTGSVLYGSRTAVINGVSGPRAVRFDTTAGSTSDLPLPAGVNAFNTVAGGRGTSNDGRIAVGWTFTGANDHRAFTYNNSLGTSLQIPLLPGGTTNDALAVGPAGGIGLVTGNSTEYPHGEAYINIYDSTSNTNAIVERLGSPNSLWSPGGRMCVEVPEGTACQPTPVLSAGLSVSGSTRIVAMNFSGSDGQAAYVHNPFGWFHLSTILAANGVNLEAGGWSNVVVMGLSRDATLLYGFGSLHGSITGWVAEFGPGVLASFNPTPAPPADTSIVGAWRCDDPAAPPRCVLIFTGDGAYYHIEQASPGDLGSGFERGYYTFDGSKLSFTTLVDTNGSIGASGANGAPMPATIVGDTLMLGDEPVAGRINGVAGTLNGAWIQGTPTQPDSSIAIVFTPSGKYLMAWDDKNQGINVDGSEIGQFTWNSTTGALVPDISQGVHTGPTPGDGLSDFAAEGPITLMMTPDGLGLDTGNPNEPQPRRVINPATIPAITNAQLSADGTVGQAFAYNVTATNTATFGASGLPGGLSIDSGTGAIAGTPNVGGQFAVTLSATNAAGVSAFKTLVVTIAIPTPVGTNVTVEPEVPAGQGPVSVTFSDVTGGGTTTVTTVDLEGSGIPSPGNVDVGGVVYEVQTTAQYTGLIQLCFSYAGIDFGTATPRLFHYENNQWVDITTTVDTNTQTICGATTSLSPFAVLVSHVVRTGFYAPVNPIAGFLNTVKGGSTVPLKFNVFVDGIEKKTTDGLLFTVQTISCDSTAPLDPVDFTVAGETSLRYDANAGHFIQNWKVPRVPGCYMVRMTTADALALTARFGVK